MLLQAQHLPRAFISIASNTEAFRVCLVAAAFLQLLA
jgi:hypothetical protein